MTNPTPCFHPQTTADGFDTLYSPADDQTFHSKFGALFETEQVFLEGSGVKTRLEAGQPTRILEVGFGTGLNFWVTAYARRLRTPPLHYVALEKTLLPATLLSQLNHGDLLPDIGAMRRKFIEWRAGLPDPLPARLHWQAEDRFQMELIIGDAVTVDIPQRDYHAIYHDAFSPEANPTLWTADFFARLYPLLRPGGRLTSYSVKGSVRRALQAVGFRVEKRPGPPGKREVLVAWR